MFHVGQKVVFIADYSHHATSAWADMLSIEMPVTGRVYTVRRIVQRIQCGDGVYGIMLAEVLNMANALDTGGVGGMDVPLDRMAAEPDEVAFDSADFRPLVSAEQSSAIQTAAPVS